MPIEVAEGRVCLNKYGSDCPVSDMTPQEAVLLHVLHGPVNGGKTFGEEFQKLKVVGTAKVSTGKTKKVIITPSVEEKVIKGKLIKAAQPEQLIPGDVLVPAIPEKREKGKLITPEVAPVEAKGKEGEDGYVPAIPGKAAVYAPDVVTKLQPEQRAPGYRIAAQPAVFEPNTITPSQPEVSREDPILVDRSAVQELMRLRKKYAQAKNKDSKPIIDVIWNDLSMAGMTSFANINWQDIGSLSSSPEVAPASVDYLTDKVITSK